MAAPASGSGGSRARRGRSGVSVGQPPGTRCCSCSMARTVWLVDANTAHSLPTPASVRTRATVPRAEASAKRPPRAV